MQLIHIKNFEENTEETVSIDKKNEVEKSIAFFKVAILFLLTSKPVVKKLDCNLKNTGKPT